MPGMVENFSGSRDEASVLLPSGEVEFMLALLVVMGPPFTH
jgi:hypothetical protein